MPDEVFSIIAAADKCKKILSEREVTLSKTASGRKRPAASSTITQAVAEIQQPTIQPSRRKGPNKMIVHYVDKWLRNTTYKLNYNLEDGEVSEDTSNIVFKLCPSAKSFTVYTDSFSHGFNFCKKYYICNCPPPEILKSSNSSDMRFFFHRRL